jgi:hypothetical protein
VERLGIIMEKDLFVRKFSICIQENRAAAFLGAGMSASAGFVNWKELLTDIAEELELDIKKEDDLISLAQYYVTKKSNRKQLVESIIENINKEKTPTYSHLLLANLPLNTFWTTNYDDLIEKSIQGTNKRYDVKRRDKDLLFPKKNSDVVVYKMHGDITDFSSVIITKDDFELYQDTHGSMLNVLKGDLTTKSFLFLGYGFNDPNLLNLLARIRCLIPEEKQEHYLIQRKISSMDFSNPEEFEYAKKKRVYHINDLRRYQIETVEIDDFSEIPILLKKISKQVNKENYFISSAVANSSVGHINETLVRAITKTLLELTDNSRITSGFGLNIGSLIIDETMKHIDTNNKFKFEEKLKLFPFSQKSPQEWTNYREMMLNDVGVCIFIYGTKEIDGKITNSTGMLEEFEIARRNGALVLPIGSTGGMSLELANKLVEDDYFKEDIEYLIREVDTQSIVKRIKEIINSNRKKVEEE